MAKFIRAEKEYTRKEIILSVYHLTEAEFLKIKKFKVFKEMYNQMEVLEKS
jgi:hypothetical protein